MGNGDELDEVVVTNIIHGNKNEASATIVDAGLHIFARASGHVEINAEDGLYFFLLTGLDEFDGAIEVAVVGKAESSHTKLFCFTNEIVNLGESGEEGVVGVGVEVGKAGHRGSIAYLLGKLNAC